MKPFACVRSFESKKAVSVTVGCMLKNNKERTVVNDYIQGEPLSEENNLVGEKNFEINFRSIQNGNEIFLGKRLLNSAMY